MDKRTQYSRLKAMIDECKVNVMTLTELQALVSMTIASTPKTVENAIRLMGMAGLIKDIGATKFKIIKNGNL